MPQPRKIYIIRTLYSHMYNDITWAWRRLNSPESVRLHQQLTQGNNKENIKARFRGLGGGGLSYRRPVVSPRKRPAMQKACSWIDVIMTGPYYSEHSMHMFINRCEKVCTVLHWCHNERDGVSNHQRIDCLLNRFFRCRLKKKENTKAPRHWPLWGKSTSHRWIPLTKGQ